MKKILLKSLLAIIVLLGSTNASAYDFKAGSICYNILSSNTCEVTDNGNNGDKDDVTYYSGSIVIPSTVVYDNRTYTVTKIGDEAFSGCHDLTSVTIPNSVTKIGDDAFSSCDGLTSITIPNSVTEIGRFAFSECNFKSIEIPNSVTEIGRFAFYGCI